MFTKKTADFNFHNKMFRRIFLSNLLINNVRNYSYKPIKRPTINSPSNKAFVEKKLKDYDLAKALKSIIEATGPIPGN